VTSAFDVSVQPGPVARLVLAGELGLAGAPRLLAAVGTLLRGAEVRRIEIDASLLRLCDAVALGFLAGAAGAAGTEEAVQEAEPPALLCAS